MEKQSFRSDINKSLKKFESFSEFLRNSASDLLKDDRFAVIIVCAFVEQVLDFLVEKVCKHGSKLSGENRSFMTKVYILDELRVIDNKILNNLANLRKLRDDAAHHPEIELKWKGKFAFDKKGDVYKQTVNIFGKPEDLVGYLYCVWNTFFLVAVEESAKRDFAKIVAAHKELNNVIK